MLSERPDETRVNQAEFEVLYGNVPSSVQTPRNSIKPRPYAEVLWHALDRAEEQSLHLQEQPVVHQVKDSICCVPHMLPFLLEPIR